MGKRGELIAACEKDLQEKCGVAADRALLGKVVKGLGPAVCRADATLVSASDPEALERLKQGFLIRKLGLAEGPALAQGVEQVIETYGRSNRQKRRAVACCVLTRHFGREAAYASSAQLRARIQARRRAPCGVPRVFPTITIG